MNKQQIVEKIREQYIREKNPGDRLPPERTMAEELHVSHGRLHQAILSLKNVGELTALPRFGLLVGRQTPFAHTHSVSETCLAPQAYNLMPLNISLPALDKNLSETLMKLFLDFREKYPFFQLNFNYDIVPPHPEDFDLCVLCPAGIRPELYMALSSMDELIPDDMIPGMLETGMDSGISYAVPFAHTFACCFGKREYADFFREIHTPEDFCSRIAAIRHRLPPGMIDFTFRCLIYHAAAFGVLFRRTKEELQFDETRLTHVLKCMAPILNQSHFEQAFRFSELKSQDVVLFCDYTSMNLPDYEILGFPLSEHGFACQNNYALAIGRNSRQKHNALMLIRHFLSDEVQKHLARAVPGLFSVRSGLFAGQAAEFRRLNPEINTAFLHFDLRGYHTLLDRQIYNIYGNRINFEFLKYVNHLQNLEETIAAMHLL